MVDFGRRPWLGTAAARRIAATATAAGVVMAAVLLDAFVNAGRLAPITVALAGIVVVLALTVTWPRPGLTEIGLLLLCAATLWPRVAHVEPGVPGALLFLVVTYGIGRLSGLSPRTLALLLIVAGALMGAIAIAQAIPSLDRRLPFSPMNGAVVRPTIRSTGLFDNPNVFGGFEATALVLAAVVGLPWRWTGRATRAGSVLLFGAVVLCFIGLGFSASRECALGLAVGLALLALVPRSGFRARVRSLLPYAVAAAVAVVVVVVVSQASSSVSRPSVSGRFDPTNVATDHNLLDRMASWRLAVDLIRQAPLIGYGATIPMRAVDNAYLEWLLAGGILGPVLWLAAVGTVAPRAARPIAAGVLVIAAFANPFAVGPTVAILLISCGALATHPPAALPAAAPAPAYSATGNPRMLKPPST